MTDYKEYIETFHGIEGEPTFALGASYASEDIKIDRIMHIADTNMYKDKADFYTSHPGADRRRR